MKNQPEALEYSLTLVGLNLIQDQDEFQEFQRNANSEMVMPPSGGIALPAQEEVLRVIHLPRDRIRVTVTGSRAGIQMDYPASEEALDRFTEVAALSISCSRNPGQLLAVGYNLSLVYEQDSAPSSHEYLAKLFKPPIRPQWNLHGGSCKLEFRDPAEAGQWNVTVEPRANDPTRMKVFMSLNLHVDTSEVPTREEIYQNMGRAGDYLCSFAIHLDQEET